MIDQLSGRHAERTLDLCELTLGASSWGDAIDPVVELSPVDVRSLAEIESPANPVAKLNKRFLELCGFAMLVGERTVSSQGQDAESAENRAFVPDRSRGLALSPTRREKSATAWVEVAPEYSADDIVHLHPLRRDESAKNGAHGFLNLRVRFFG